MSGLAYAALAAAVLTATIGLTLWLGFRSARKSGGAETEAVASQKVAEHARTANAARTSNAGLSDDAARDRLRSKWQRD